MILYMPYLAFATFAVWSILSGISIQERLVSKRNKWLALAVVADLVAASVGVTSTTRPDLVFIGMVLPNVLFYVAGRGIAWIFGVRGIPVEQQDQQ